MKKATIVIIGGFSMALIIAILLTQKPKSPIVPSKGIINNAPIAVASSPAQLKTYANPSGFSFQYPKSYLLTEKKINDQSIYAWVELADPQKKGGVSIKLESSDLTKIDDWFTVTKKNSIDGDTKKVNLADLEGREFTIGNKVTTIALDQGGVLISIATDLSLPVHQQIVSSFIFTQPPQITTNTSGDGSGDIIFEGEEVVQ